jgi:hypothetical protein
MPISPLKNEVVSWTPAFTGVTEAETPRIVVIPAKAGIQLGATRDFFNGLLGLD